MSSYERRRAAQELLDQLALPTPELAELRDIASDLLTHTPDCGAIACEQCDQITVSIKRFARLLCDIEVS